MTNMRFLAVFFSICFYSFAQAQQMSLKDAVSIALKKNLDIQIQENNTEISRINNNRGMAGGLPLVTFNATDQRSVNDVNQKLNTGIEINRSGAYSDALNANIIGSMLLYNGYRVVATKKKTPRITETK